MIFKMFSSLLRFSIFLALSICCLAGRAQLLSASVEIDGLTCSMCSYGVQKSIEDLRFVEGVSVDLNENIALVQFKKDVTVSILDLSQSIRAAGFSVRRLIVSFMLKTTLSKERPHFILDNASCFLVGVMEDIPPGVVNLQVIDRDFSDRELYNRFKDLVAQGSSAVVSETYYFAVF